MDYVIFNIVTVEAIIYFIISFFKVIKKKIILKTIIARDVSEKYKVV